MSTKRIEAYLRRDPIRHVYAIGDLDDAFWPHTRWWGLERSGDLVAVVLLYSGLKVPTCLALTDDLEPLRVLFALLAPLLPDAVYLHLEPGLVDLAQARWSLADHGVHVRMALTDPAPMSEADADSEIRWLAPEDREELLAFYDRAFPEHWFDPRTLSSGLYAGLEREGALVSVAGVHVWSAPLGVAALGNIATTPESRRCGYGRRVTAAVTGRLLGLGCSIGLNVAASNTAAIRVYERLGFTEHCVLNEWEATSPSAPQIRP
jgi:GNAT superfamily N-acetyltransferase